MTTTIPSPANAITTTNKIVIEAVTPATGPISARAFPPTIARHAARWPPARACLARPPRGRRRRQSKSSPANSRIASPKLARSAGQRRDGGEVMARTTPIYWCRMIILSVVKQSGRRIPRGVDRCHLRRRERTVVAICDCQAAQHDDHHGHCGHGVLSGGQWSLAGGNSCHASRRG